jgi:hypothetical protein
MGKAKGADAEVTPMEPTDHLIAAGDQLYRIVRWQLMNGSWNEQFIANRLDALARWTSAKTAFRKEFQEPVT